MKIIFLDHDGVICLEKNWGGRNKKEKKWRENNPEKILEKENPLECRFDDFDKKSIMVLNEILEESGAEIIISSDWKKYANVTEMGIYYEQQGIIKKPIGFTRFAKDIPLPTSNEFKWNRHDSLEQERHFEILEWLGRHPEVTHWVSIDDLYMWKFIDDGENIEERDWGLTNFVWTPLCDEGIKQTGIKEKILKYLK